MCISIDRILPRGNPTQVISPIVVAYSISVTDLVTTRGRSMEGFAHQPVDAPIVFATVRHKFQAAIARRRLRLQYAANVAAVPPSDHPFHVAEIGNGVLGETGGWQPSFSVTHMPYAYNFAPNETSVERFTNGQVRA